MNERGGLLLLLPMINGPQYLYHLSTLYEEEEERKEMLSQHCWASFCVCVGSILGRERERPTACVSRVIGPWRTLQNIQDPSTGSTIDERKRKEPHMYSNL